MSAMKENGLSVRRRPGTNPDHAERHDEEDQDGNADIVEESHHEEDHRSTIERMIPGISADLGIIGAEILATPFELVAWGQLERFELLADII